MKRFVLIFVFSIVAFSYSSAQDKPSVSEDPNGGYLALGYDFILTDEVDGKWSLSVEYRNKRYFGNAIYAGFGLGLYFPHTNTSIKDYDMQVKTSQTHFLLPVFIGAGNKTGKFTLDTGPYLDWGIAGKTTVKYGGETEVTRLKDQEGVKRVSFGWQFMLRAGIIHFGVRLPFPQDDVDPVSMLTLGVTF